jgi:Tfp pilus assembly protein PilF
MRLALTYLEQGDVPAAAQNFKEALDSPEFKDPLPAQRVAKEYLRAIDRAARGRGAGP